MEQIFAFLSELPNLIVALNAVIVALIALFVLIPGSQPEAFLQKCVDLLAKFSRK
jgi:hypothetical protein